MSRVKEYILMLLSLAVLILSIFMFINNKNNNEKQEDKAVNNTEEYDEIDEATYKKLLEESTDENIKQKVLDYLASDKYYNIQEELEYEGKIYKSVQICNLEHVDYAIDFNDYRHYKHDMLYMYYAKDEKIKKIFDESLEKGKYFIDESEEQRSHNEIIRYYMPSIMYPLDENKISFYRDKDFGFMEEYCITALVCYDENGEIEDVKTFQGATGIHVKKNESGGLIWEVYIAEQIDYYWSVAKYKSGEKVIEGASYSKGTVYDVYIDNNKVNDIRFKYKSWDNRTENTSAYYWVYQGQKMYVKNYNLSIYDIIYNEELRSKIDYYQKTGNYSNGSLVALAREFFGQNTVENYRNSCDEAIYITKEGYIVTIDPIKAYYAKMTLQEYADMPAGKREESLDGNEKPLFIDGEINPELLKELEEK